ncbi:ABC transporter substrate-binding protein [Actinospica sp.]|jgi:ABC-type amino acid transport substrate-binding protein|uniref:ABC transporter substrate-binding protein n=1 Tax=Actinospica sp. TaxID=1872142 RepID=UPI002C324DDF|nr:ABC transporter substrate-binding protein [Actinospica sp.]HWG22480.1 ABC transporter substrate-binding protein [Actinospica sp.]
MRSTTAARLAVALATAGAILALAACSGGGTAGSASSSDGTIASGTLTVGSDLTYPPYAYLNGTTPAGFDPDVTRALAEQAGLRVTYTDTRFEQLIPGLGAGRFDVIASDLYVTDERAKQVDFIPYFTTGNSLLAATGGSFRPKTTADLCSKAVAVIKGGEIVQELRGEASDACTAKGAKPVDVREFDTDPEATEALLSGQVDAQLTDAAVAKAIVTKTSGKLTITSSTIIYPVTAGLAVKKGNTKLKATLTKALAALEKSGAYAKLLSQYNLSEAGES